MEGDQASSSRRQAAPTEDVPRDPLVPKRMYDIEALIEALDDPRVVAVIAKRFPMVVECTAGTLRNFARVEDALKVHDADVKAQRAAAADKK